MPGHFSPHPPDEEGDDIYDAIDGVRASICLGSGTIVIKSGTRLLTEGLEVRILVPTKKSVNIEIAAFTESRPAAFPSRARRTSLKQAELLLSPLREFP